MKQYTKYTTYKSKVSSNKGKSVLLWILVRCLGQSINFCEGTNFKWTYGSAKPSLALLWIWTEASWRLERKDLNFDLTHCRFRWDRLKLAVDCKFLRLWAGKYLFSRNFMDLGSGGFKCRAFKTSTLKCSLNNWTLILTLPSGKSVLQAFCSLCRSNRYLEIKIWLSVKNKKIYLIFSKLNFKISAFLFCERPLQSRKIQNKHLPMPYDFRR